MARRRRRNRREVKRTEKIVEVVRSQPRQRAPPRRARPTAYPLPMIARDTALYIRSLYDDVSIPGLVVPTDGNFNGPFSRSLYRASYTPTLSANAALTTSCVLNPYMLWADNFTYEKLGAGAQIVCNVPTAYTSNAIDNTGLPHSTAASLASSPLNFDGYIAVNQANPYSGYVRCLGVHFRIVYTGSLTNKGGQILAFTNPQRMALACQDETATTGSGPRFYTMFTTNSEIDAARNLYVRSTMDDSFSFTWRPSDLSFKRVDSFKADGTPVVAGATAGNPACQDILPSYEAGAGSVENGWMTGFQLRPAAGTAGAAANYYVEISAELEVALQRTGDTAAGSSAYSGSLRAHHDPVAHAHIRNALADIHHRRMTRTPPPGAKSLAINQLVGTAKKGLKAAVIGGVEAVGERLAASFL